MGFKENKAVISFFLPLGRNLILYIVVASRLLVVDDLAILLGDEDKRLLYPVRALRYYLEGVRELRREASDLCIFL